MDSILGILLFLTGQSPAPDPTPIPTTQTPVAHPDGGGVPTTPIPVGN